jgi:hypothetical protein
VCTYLGIDATCVGETAERGASGCTALLSQRIVAQMRVCASPVCLYGIAGNLFKNPEII